MMEEIMSKYLMFGKTLWLYIYNIACLCPAVLVANSCGQTEIPDATSPFLSGARAVM